MTQLLYQSTKAHHFLLEHLHLVGHIHRGQGRLFTLNRHGLSFDRGCICRHFIGGLT